jgi:TatD DNase family protein
VDAHLHLADPAYSGRVEIVLEDAVRNGVNKLLSNAVDYDTSIRTIELAKQHEGTVLAAIGLHPSTVVNNPKEDLDKFETLLSSSRPYVNAIGEIGLDGKYTEDELKTKSQKEVLRFFLGVAEKNRLPAVIHSRLATEQVFDELSRFSPPSVLLHWYDGPVEQLKLVQENGYLISVGPAVMYSKRITEIARLASLTVILSETDGPVPYHGPFEGKQTQPSHVVNVVRKLAEIRSIKVETVREAIWNNFQRFITGKRSV